MGENCSNRRSFITLHSQLITCCSEWRNRVSKKYIIIRFSIPTPRSFHLFLSTSLLISGWVGVILRCKLKCQIDKLQVVEGVDAEGYNPLHWASIHNQLEVAKLLLDYGCFISLFSFVEGRNLRYFSIPKSFFESFNRFIFFSIRIDSMKIYLSLRMPPFFINAFFHSTNSPSLGVHEGEP